MRRITFAIPARGERRAAYRPASGGERWTGTFLDPRRQGALARDKPISYDRHRDFRAVGL